MEKGVNGETLKMAALIIVYMKEAAAAKGRGHERNMVQCQGCYPVTAITTTTDTTGLPQVVGKKVIYKFSCDLSSK